MTGQKPATQKHSVDAGDLCEAFARTVARWDEAPALRSSDGTTQLTWREFDARMRAAAGGLADLGVGAGGTVAMLLTNRYEAAVLDMATLHRPMPFCGHDGNRLFDSDAGAGIT